LFLKDCTLGTKLADGMLKKSEENIYRLMSIEEVIGILKIFLGTKLYIAHYLKEFKASRST